MSVAETWVDAYLQSVHRIHLRQRVLPRRLKAALLEFARHRETTVERNTQSTDHTVQGHLLSFFEDVPIVEIAPRLQAFADDLGRRGYVPATIRTYMQSVHAFLIWADLPIPELALPAVPERIARFWDDAELLRLREAADYVGPNARLAFELVVGSGARQQELFALTWQALDESARTVRITEQLDRDRHAHARRKPLKGKRARTALVLPAFWSYLEAHVPDWRARIGLILPGAGAGGAMYRAGQERVMRAILDAARLREPGVMWHVGRHTYGRLVLEAGGSLEQLRVFLGHKSITTTDQTYGHLTEDAAVRIARERIFGTA